MRHEANRSARDSKKRRRSPSREHVETRNDGLAKLLSWLESAGIVLSDAVAVVERDGQFSVEATQALRARDVIGTIPLSAVLSIDSVPEVSCRLERFQLHEDLDLGLSACILWERVKGSASKWAGYFDAIRPKAYDTPIGWSEEKMKSVLGDTPFLAQVVADKHRLEQAWSLAVKPLLEECVEECSGTEVLVEELLSLLGFTTAFQINSSRAFLPREDVGEALVPLADLFNHKAAYVCQEVLCDASVEIAKCPDILVGCTDDDALTVFAVQEMEEKRELFNTYGEFGNRVLFLEYGFTLRENMFNTLEIPWPRAEASRSSRQRQYALKRLALDAPFIEELLELSSIHLSSSGDLPEAVIYRTILVSCEMDDFDKITSAASDLQAQLAPYLASFHDRSHTSAVLIQARNWIRSLLQKETERVRRQERHEQLRRDDLQILRVTLAKVPQE